MRAAEFTRFSLPVSGRAITVRQPTGIEDILLVESGQSVTARALCLAERLASAVDGAPLDWETLSVTDLDAFVLGLRRALIGDRIVAEIVCRAEGCGHRIDLSFAISQYLDRHRPSTKPPRLRNWSVTEIDEAPGWYGLAPGADDGTTGTVAVSFRLPSAVDQIAVEGVADPAEALASRCLRPADVPRAWRRAVEATMAKLAPILCNDLAGTCPECGAGVQVNFDPRRFCLRELLDRARFVYDDVDVLAQRYHWSERAILALPSARRASYAELARQSGGA